MLPPKIKAKDGKLSQLEQKPKTKRLCPLSPKLDLKADSPSGLWDDYITGLLQSTQNP